MEKSLKISNRQLKNFKTLFHANKETSSISDYNFNLNSNSSENQSFELNNFTMDNLIEKEDEVSTEQFKKTSKWTDKYVNYFIFNISVIL